MSKTPMYLLEMRYSRPIVDTNDNNAGVSGSIYIIHAIDFVATKTPAFQASAMLIDWLGPYTYHHRAFDTSEPRFP